MTFCELTRRVGSNWPAARSSSTRRWWVCPTSRCFSKRYSVGLLDGKVAVITGAGRGVGRGIARGLVREGASVVIAEISAEHGEKAVAAIRSEIADRVAFVRTDVTRKEDIERALGTAVKQFGGLD